MRMTDVTGHLAGLGGDKWQVHLKARELIDAGADILEMTIGEPDVPTPDALVEAAVASMRAGRTGYSNGRGEAGLLDALAARYTKSRGRPFGPENFLCFPGTQTALFAVMAGVAQAGDDVLVGDPMYATYEGVVRATGADMVPVPLRAEHGFRMQAEDIAARVTPRSRAILLTTPHNPTGAMLTPEDVAAIGRVAEAHDLWIISDEVYEELVFEGGVFTSPLADPELADRVIAVSSISKSHAAPGFRSGWCAGPAAFCAALLPYSETMLFGNQPFIADMTEQAVRDGSDVAPGMAARFAARAALLAERLDSETDLTVHRPEAGMFAMINVAATGLDGEAYAWDLLQAGVAVMPGSAFGAALKDWVRVALTVDDAAFATAVSRIVTHANAKTRVVA
ncbi:pyridoxal phosphate-dependent aminotransferase [Thalassorhabdomicrobium marinisediminis]|uniref:pyridoxal phosphate-dependent aminotransferase n=1 Tax=Thalassorhabdomicrobium marinisediminis TaxID=2170577 RepID=UPI002493058D|nr:pyridoxal phosphate-dependent aminotransferase [Thalassorhabdomicrobium marinisediminis]